MVGEAERRLGAPSRSSGCGRSTTRTCARSGADPDELAIGYDIVPRPGRPLIPVAFTTGTRPARAVGRSRPTGGRPGQPRRAAPRERARPRTTRRSGRGPPSPSRRADYAAFFEAIADLLGWDVDEPAFQARHLGVSVEPRDALLDRYGGVLLDACWALFEIELHRAPDRRPNDVWAEFVADGLGIEPHPEWSWWAVRGQLIDSPGYLANYGLSAIAAAALRARIRELRGDWSTGDPGWYAFVSERLLRVRRERAPRPT